MRVLTLPAPMRDARVWRTLITLDLESHPPAAAVDAFELEVNVAPSGIVQGALLARALPSKEALTTLIARLSALMGESRVGAPALVDSHDDREYSLAPFAAGDPDDEPGAPADRADRRDKASVVDASRLCLRRFRLPIAAEVIVVGGAPRHVRPAARGLAGGRIVVSSGPWRTSGRWWAGDRTVWDRDVWDVELADGGVYRLAYDRCGHRWEIEGVVD